jgi:hypothetical protein
MSGIYVVAVEGLSAIQNIGDLPKQIAENARRAIEATLKRTRTDAAQRMMRQVNFTARYLTGENGKLALGKRPTTSNLEGSIIGRQRPTSLATFSSGGTPNRPGMRVQVKPGFARFLPKAFLFRLRAGTANIETRSNLGLAIRLKRGETIRNKKHMIALDRNLYLLYGPSVDQVFNTVSEDVSLGAAAFLENEFSRLMELPDG